MTNDYNNGAWWGWNGGECPVHPLSQIEVRWAESELPPEVYGSGGFWAAECWLHNEGYGHIIAFRVIKEHREPREFWITIPRAGSYGIVHTKPDGIHLPGFIHVQEKMP